MNKPIRDRNLVRLYAIDHPNCEICENLAVDVHHIEFKKMGGGNGGDNHENLISLCRHHHTLAHGDDSKWWRDFFKKVKNHDINKLKQIKEGLNGKRS